MSRQYLSRFTLCTNRIYVYNNGFGILEAWKIRKLKIFIICKNSLGMTNI